MAYSLAMGAGCCSVCRLFDFEVGPAWGNYPSEPSTPDTDFSIGGRRVSSDVIYGRCPD